MARWRTIRFQALDFSSKALLRFSISITNLLLQLKKNATTSISAIRSEKFEKKFKEMYDNWWIANICLIQAHNFKSVSNISAALFAAQNF